MSHYIKKILNTMGMVTLWWGGNEQVPLTLLFIFIEFKFQEITI